MSADAFHVCYGLRWKVDAKEEVQATQKLLAARFTEEPAWHFGFEPDL